MDHDQKMKEALREFWWDFLLVYWPWLTLRLKRDPVEWLTQEVFTNPPFGLVRRLDLVARVEAHDGGEQLLNFEVESATSLTDVRRKLAYYYPTLRLQRNRTVTTLALYLNVGREGRGWDEYAEREDNEEDVYRVRWRYVGLPALRAEDYLASGNILGVALAALMKIDADRKPWLRAEILSRIAVCRENDYRKLLLINLVETYLPMEGRQQSADDILVSQNARYQEANQVILTTYDKGKAAGERIALQRMLLEFASENCGAPDEVTRQKVQQIEDVAVLERLCKATRGATSWEELLAGQ